MHPTIFELREEAQAWADEAIDAMGESPLLKDHPALSSLRELLDEANPTEVVCEKAN